jgi:predicted CXXCH cytochrome family protein
MKKFALMLGIVLVSVVPVSRAAQDVVNTRHNLSTVPPSGVTRTPGLFSSTVDEVCVFCHTPHSAMGEAQLWNHTLSEETNYILYGSSTLSAVPQQPTGKSRLCLACHDGTVALGDLANPPAGNDLGSTLMTGRGNLSTDLSDDHPISFPYNAGLLGLNPELADPAGIGLPLEGQDLQCTTCHDPHEKDLQPFLRISTINGELCTTCHVRADNWATSTHATSAAAVGAADLDNRRPEWVAATVAGNSCLSCHAPHNAQNAERLIAKDGENTCYGCHDGSPASDIEGDFLKFAAHPVADPLYDGEHDATKIEDPATMPLHVECADCHNPHTVVPNELPMISFNPNNLGAPHATPPAANALIADVTGLDLNGNATTTVTYQYELCFKCHGRSGQNSCGTSRCGSAGTRGMLRVDMLAGDPLLGGVELNRSIRDRVYSATSGLISWHPIESNNSANNSNVPSLRTDIPLDTINSVIYCTDCHNSDASEASGGVGPNGPHGSTEEGLLADGYVLDINSTASDTASYALCYKCHDEAIIRSAASFNKHDAHLGNRQGSCMKCHDPHGSHEAARMINFLWMSDGQEIIDCVRGKGGGTQPCDFAGTGYSVPTWVDGPGMTGECWLVCHGTGHSGKTY